MAKSFRDAHVSIYAELHYGTLYGSTHTAVPLLSLNTALASLHEDQPSNPET